jgi:hypothetical protein
MKRGEEKGLLSFDVRLSTSVSAKVSPGKIQRLSSLRETRIHISLWQNSPLLTDFHGFSGFTSVNSNFRNN